MLHAFRPRAVLVLLAVGCSADYDRLATPPTEGEPSVYAGSGPAAAMPTSAPLPERTLGGLVEGYVGPGLVVASGTGQMTVVPPAATAFVFPGAVAPGLAYDVAIVRQPNTESCTLTNGRGTIAGADVLNVSIQCTTLTAHVCLRVVDLAAGSTGLGATNGGDALTAATTGLYCFATPVGEGQPYAIALTDPTTPAQHCALTDGSGTIAGGDPTATATCN